MLSVNFYFFIFLLFFQQASTQGFNITVLMANCLPVAVGLQNEAIAQYQLQKGCQSLELPYREMLDLRCCEVEYQEKENSSAPRYHGCMSFLSNYIDNDRYEDIIDWIERGKLDKYEYYNIFLGKTVYNMSHQYPLVKNETKYELFKLDCFSEFIFLKNVIVFALILLML